MDTSRDEINYLTMHFGGLQVSPKHMANLNSRAGIPFRDEMDQSPSVAGYQVMLNGYANYIYNLERNTRNFSNLTSLLRGLRSNPRPFEGEVKKR